MRLNVKFKESKQKFTPGFGEINNISDGGYERGYQAGYDQGYTDGFAEGETKGKADGYKQGYDVGIAEGENSGYNKGYEAGYKAGYAKGKEDGYAEGHSAGYTEGETAGYSNGYTEGKAEGIEQGYENGFSDGNLLYYAGCFDATFDNVTFPENYNMVLRVKKFSATAYRTFALAKNLKSVKIITDDKESPISLNQVFRECPNLEIVDLTECSRKICKADYAFFQSNKIISVLGALDLSKITDTANYAFFFNVRDLEFVPNTIYKSIRVSSANLTEASKESIINGLADLTGGTAQTITLNGVGAKLTAEQKARIAAKNWTLAY
jgi:hypothetical protein